MTSRTYIFLTLLAVPIPAGAQSVDKLQVLKGQASAADYRGVKAVRLVQPPGPASDMLAIVQGTSIDDGTIEIDVAGAPAPGAFGDARGFIGIAFRVQPDAAKYELFYIRPTNGRADDQLRRNHSTQYVSFPDWPWERTRAATPGLYESYADLEPGVWTKLKVVVAGQKARLFVRGNEQPSLVVNDLKLPPAKGGIALWAGPGTDGYFANLRVTPQP